MGCAKAHLPAVALRGNRSVLTGEARLKRHARAGTMAPAANDGSSPAAAARPGHTWPAPGGDRRTDTGVPTRGPVPGGRRPSALRQLPALTNHLALRALLPDRWAAAHPEHVNQFRRAESAKAATRRLNRRERRREQAK